MSRLNQVGFIKDKASDYEEWLGVTKKQLELHRSVIKTNYTYQFLSHLCTARDVHRKSQTMNFFVKDEKSSNKA